MNIFVALSLMVAQPGDKFVPVVKLSEPIRWTWEQERMWNVPLQFSTITADLNPKLMIEYKAPTMLKIACGEGGWININLKNGDVTLERCNPDAAGKAFWKTVTAALPEIRRGIMEGQKR